MDAPFRAQPYPCFVPCMPCALGLSNSISVARSNNGGPKSFDFAAAPKSLRKQAPISISSSASVWLGAGARHVVNRHARAYSPRHRHRKQGVIMFFTPHSRELMVMLPSLIAVITAFHTHLTEAGKRTHERLKSMVEKSGIKGNFVRNPKPTSENEIDKTDARILGLDPIELTSKFWSRSKMIRDAVDVYISERLAELEMEGSNMGTDPNGMPKWKRRNLADISSLSDLGAYNPISSMINAIKDQEWSESLLGQEEQGGSDETFVQGAKDNHRFAFSPFLDSHPEDHQGREQQLFSYFSPYVDTNATTNKNSSNGQAQKSGSGSGIVDLDAGNSSRDLRQSSNASSAFRAYLKGKPASSTELGDRVVFGDFDYCDLDQQEHEHRTHSDSDGEKHNRLNREHPQNRHHPHSHHHSQLRHPRRHSDQQRQAWNAFIPSEVIPMEEEIAPTVDGEPLLENRDDFGSEHKATLLAQLENQHAIVYFYYEGIDSEKWNSKTRPRVLFRFQSKANRELAVQSYTAVALVGTVDDAMFHIPLGDAGPDEVPSISTVAVSPVKHYQLAHIGSVTGITLSQRLPNGIGELEVDFILVNTPIPSKTVLQSTSTDASGNRIIQLESTRGMLCWKAKLKNVQQSNLVLRQITMMKGATEMKDVDTKGMERRPSRFGRSEIEYALMMICTIFILAVSASLNTLDYPKTLSDFGLTPQIALLTFGSIYYWIQRRSGDHGIGLISVLLLCLLGLQEDFSNLWPRALIGILGVLDYIYRRFYRDMAPASTGDRAVLSNGWQSWSFCGTVLQGLRMPRPGLPDVFSAAFHDGAGTYFEVAPWEVNAKDEAIVSDMFAMVGDRARKFGMVFGFLTQKKQFGAITFDSEQTEVGVHCNCDEVRLTKNSWIETDWAAIMFMPKLPLEPLADYMNLVGLINNAPKFQLSDVHTGWCSWYHYMYDISERCIRSNLDHLLIKRREYPITLFQIDDGFEPKWGDWTNIKKEFPRGEETLKDLAQSISKEGLLPGIWLAPFSCDKGSKLEKEHPSWILKYESGRYANSANCGKFFLGLDVTNPDVQKHARETLVRAVKSWNFKYLKLDFLYSSILKARRANDRITRAEAMQLGFQIIRESVGQDTFVLGCGSPLGSAIGWVNGMRISADTGPTWKPPFPLSTTCQWNLPCARNMVRNTITRSAMHGRWWINDPDCILVREQTFFTIDEVIGIATVVAMSGAMTLLSDDLLHVSQSRMALAKAFNPVTGKAAIPLDLLDNQIPENLYLHVSKRWSNPSALPNWHVLALCNWKDWKREREFDLLDVLREDDLYALVPEKHAVGSTKHHDYKIHIFEFWSQSYQRIEYNTTRNKGMSVTLKSGGIPAHSAGMYSVRLSPAEDDAVQFVGSNIHFTTGFEVVGLKQGNREVKLELFIKRDVPNGQIFLSIPGTSSKTMMIVSGNAKRAPEHNEPSMEWVSHDIWKVRVQLIQEKPVDLAIQW